MTVGYGLWNTCGKDSCWIVTLVSGPMVAVIQGKSLGMSGQETRGNQRGNQGKPGTGKPGETRGNQGQTGRSDGFGSTANDSAIESFRAVSCGQQRCSKIVLQRRPFRRHTLFSIREAGSGRGFYCFRTVFGFEAVTIPRVRIMVIPNQSSIRGEAD